MQRLFIHPRVLGVCLIVGLLAGAATLYAFSRPVQSAPVDQPAPQNPEPVDPLAQLPEQPSERASDRAIRRCTERARQRERVPLVWTELGEALMQKARETADASYYTHAERSFAKALAVRPGHADAATGMAWVYSCRHEFEKSAEWAQKAADADPRDPRPFGLLGDAALEMGDYEAAFGHYQKMLDVRPDVSSYSRGAHLLYLTGDVRKATWMMQKALDSGAPYAENRAWCQSQLALIHFNTGNLMAAEGIIAQARGTATEDPRVLAVCGKIKAARGDTNAAIDCYRKSAEAAPLPEVIAALGDLYTLAGRKEEAAQQFDLVEKIHQVNKANGVRGDSALALFHADHDRDLPEALALVQEEYKTRKNVFVTDALAWCLYKNGHYAEARAKSQLALAHKTPDASLLYHAGMIDAKLGDRPKAQLHLYQALSLNPHFHPLQAKIAADTLAELGARPPTGGTQEKMP